MVSLEIPDTLLEPGVPAGGGLDQPSAGDLWPLPLPDCGPLLSVPLSSHGCIPPRVILPQTAFLRS